MDHPDRLDRLSVLSEHELLKELPERDRLMLAQLAKERAFRLGQVIFEKGTPGSALLCVLSGHVKVSTLSLEGREVTLNLFGPGDWFGEIAWIDGGPRTADAVALDHARVLVIERAHLLPRLRENGHTALKLAELLCRRIRHTSQTVENISFRSLPARLATVLLELVDEYGTGVGEVEAVRIGIRLSQRELGNLIATSRESTNKQLAAWQAEGLLRTVGGFLEITDPGRLRRIAEAEA